MRAKPLPSNELRYLRLVMSQDQADDNKDDVELGRYRNILNDENGGERWIVQQKAIREKEHRDELIAWKKDYDQEVRNLQAEQKSVVVDDKLEPVEELLKRQLEEWEQIKPS